ncbi:MAG: response regulator [Planctomycetes bacterium]|nr:response regulator [Planctomycetota bacterium]
MSEISTESLNVLIVEDEPPIALAERKAIEFANHTAKVADNGAAALKILTKGGIDVVLLDHQLPDKNGSDLLKIIVEQYQDIPVIMITGHGDERLVAEVMKAGAKDYIVKDYEANYLKALPKTIEQFYLNSKLEAKARQLQQQLVLSDERLELALNGGNIGLWDWNVLTREMFVDKQWAKIQGYGVDEIEPHINTIQKMTHPDDIALVNKGMDALLEDRIDIFNNEFRMKNKSGEWQWVSIHCKVTKRDRDEKPVHVSGTHCDITKRKNMEEALLGVKHK